MTSSPTGSACVPVLRSTRRPPPTASVCASLTSRPSGTTCGAGCSATGSSARSLAEVLGDADVLLANETEATAMTGEAKVERALDRLAEHCDCVVIKRGGAGALGLAGGQVRAVPADPVEIVDTTGAGDCFNAGFLAGWLGGLGLEEALTLGGLRGSR